MPQHTKHIANP